MLETLACLKSDGDDDDYNDDDDDDDLESPVGQRLLPLDRIAGTLCLGAGVIIAVFAIITIKIIITIIIAIQIGIRCVSVAAALRAKQGPREPSKDYISEIKVQR